MSLVNRLISETWERVCQQFNKFWAIVAWLFNKLKKWSLRAAERLSNLSQKSRSLFKQGKVSTIEDFYLEFLRSHHCHATRCEELGVWVKNFFQITCHVFVFEFTTRVVRPKTEVHRVHNEAVSCDLLKGILFNIAQVPVLPFVKAHLSCFQNFLFNLVNKILNSEVVDVNMVTIKVDQCRGSPDLLTGIFTH